MTALRGFPIEHAVDQAGHRSHPRRVPLAAVPVDRAERLEPPQPADGVLHLDPPPREGPVVAAVLRGPLPAARLAPGRRPAQPPDQPVAPQVRPLAQGPHPRPRQPAGQPRAAEHTFRSAHGPGRLSPTSTTLPSSATATWLLSVCALFLPE